MSLFQKAEFFFLMHCLSSTNPLIIGGTFCLCSEVHAEADGGAKSPQSEASIIEINRANFILLSDCIMKAQTQPFSETSYQVFVGFLFAHFSLKHLKRNHELR